MFNSLTQEMLNTYVAGDKGLHVGVPHIDKKAHEYLAENLKTWGIERLYVEISNDDFKTLESSVKNFLESVKNEGGTKLDRCKAFNQSYPGLQYFIAYSIIHEVPVVPIDLTSIEFAKVKKILHGETPATLAEQKETLRIRESHDETMVKNIQRDYSAGHGDVRHMILTGPMHAGIAESIKVKSFHIFGRKYLDALQKIDLNSQKLKDKIQDFSTSIFLYSEVGTGRDSNLLYNNDGFFSPSKYAVIDQPYGPYMDKYCSPEDAQVKEGLEYSRKNL